MKSSGGDGHKGKSESLEHHEPEKKKERSERLMADGNDNANSCRSKEKPHNGIENSSLVPRRQITGQPDN